MSEELNALLKTNEGIMLGLGAVAELLQKMNDRLEKAEEDEDEEDEEDLEKASYEALTEDVADRAVTMLKEGQGMDVEGRDEYRVSGGDTWPMSSRPAAEDEEDPTKVRTDTDEVQKPIQAMHKAHDPAECEHCRMYAGKTAEEYPKEEDKGEEDKEEKKSLDAGSEIVKLRKEMAELKKDMDVKIKKEAEERLRKMGFREERNLAAPALKSLGADEVPIIKSDEKGSADPVSELMKLPYSTLRRMQFQIEGGQTQGVPRELLR